MRTLLVLAGLLGGAVPVAAQTDPVTPLEDTHFEETLVVSASLEEESADRLTASVTVIEVEEIESRQSTAVADLLKTVPGLAVPSSGSAGKVTSLFSRGTESDHTLALWNGIELNNPFFGGFDWAFLPTEGVQRVEIVRGPYSALYGSDAIGGVVQVLTDGRSGGSIRLEAGERGYGHLALDAGTSGESTEIDVRGHIRRGDGEMENDSFDSEEMALSARWNAGKGLSASLLVRANNSDNGIPMSGGVASPEREISWSERQLAVPVAYQRGLWEIDGRVSLVSYTTLFRDPLDAFGFTASETESESERVRASAVRRFADSSWIAFGGEVEEFEVDDRSVFGVNLERAGQRTRSVFAQATRDFSRVRLDFGLRHDDNDAFGSRTTPKLGALLRFGERSRLRASWGEGFRAPSIGELFYPFSGNSALEPEESESWELGFEHDFASWNLGLTAFENHLFNLIDFDFLTFTNRNIGRATTRGLEVWSRYSGRRLTIMANATVLEAEDLETGESLLRRPEESGSVVITASPGVWDLSLTASYVGDRGDIDPATFLPTRLASHMRFDLATRFEKGETLKPYARVENLTDTEYEEVAGYPAPGRRWIVGLAVAWK